MGQRFVPFHKSYFFHRLILVLVGCLVGCWIQSGVVATMIYYGLGVMSPRFFYCASLLISVVVALATGCC